MIFIEIILILVTVLFSLDLILIWVDYISSCRFLKKMEESIKEVQEIIEDTDELL